MKEIMKNKNILILTILSSFLLIVISCEDNLDLNPISNYNAGSFYKTQNDFGLAVNGIYDKLQELYYYNIVPFGIEGRSDNVNVNTGYDAGALSQLVDNETTGVLTAMWRYCYQIIDRSNAVINQIEEGIFTDENYKNYYKGEAYFMRGYAYSQLGYFFGGVPLFDQQMDVDEIKLVARSTQEETFNFAANDLTQAIALLPSEWTSAELGKATKYSATGILARLYIFQQKYSEAKPLLSDIISSDKYEMATNYSDCFNDKFDNGAEHVFQIQYTSGDLGEGNMLPIVSAPQNIDSPLFPQGGGSPFLNVSKDLYDSYESGDLRRDFTIQKGYTDKSGVVDNVTSFYIKFAQGTIPATLDDYAVNLPVLRYTDVKLMYAEVLNEENFIANGEAFSILNAVRDRAGLPNLAVVELTGKEEFRTAIFNERRWEFAGEYLRWFDIVRSGKATEIMNSFLQQPENGNSLYSMDNHQTIFAIPQYELDINTDSQIMWQNDGY